MLTSCDNRCSGHGVCDQVQGLCSCYDNWGLGMSHISGDCADRICPFEIAWFDFPNSIGTRHGYLECAGVGICNRVSGECECFEGFEGKACQRRTCPNGCSGHGTCKFIEKVGYGAVEFDYRHSNFHQSLETFSYYGWDKRKMRGCLCDPEYTEYDCSKRLCPRGNDVMVSRDNVNTYQSQLLHLMTDYSNGESLSDLNGKTFAITFKSQINETFTTMPIVFDSTDLTAMALAIRRSMKRLPQHVVDEVEITLHIRGPANSHLLIVVQFTGANTQGPQYLLTIEDAYCADGCTPRLSGIKLFRGNSSEVVQSDYNNYECGRRGRCDYKTGVCKCFEGFTGVGCSVTTSLR